MPYEAGDILKGLHESGPSVVTFALQGICKFIDFKL